jgi:uncharacterized protein (TIGR02284 family)
MEINNDRVEGYKKALKETNDADLKELFKNMAEHSFGFKNELADEIMKNGGEPTSGTCTSGKFYRAWMDIRAALTNKDRKSILSSCEYGEDAAREVYEDVSRNIQAPAAFTIISKQKTALQRDHDKIKQLRDMQQ